MLILGRDNVQEYLVGRRVIPPRLPIQVRTRISDPARLVLSVAGRGSHFGTKFELKQVRPLSRGGQVWPESLNRVWNEVTFLVFCQNNRCFTERIKTLPFLFKDQENYIVGSTHWIPEFSHQRLDVCSGETDDRLAAQCGEFLGHLHSVSWDDGRKLTDLNDRSVFRHLFVEPCLRLGQGSGRLEQAIEQAIDEMWNTRRCIVHGSFTADKLARHGHTVVTSELAHYGDPSLDAATFLASLVLAMIAVPESSRANVLHMIHAFCVAYTGVLLPTIGTDEFTLLQRRAMRLAGVSLLSIVEQVFSLSALQEVLVRSIALELLARPPASWSDMEQELSHKFPLCVALPPPRFYDGYQYFS